MNLKIQKQSVMAGAISYAALGVLVGLLLIFVSVDFLLDLAFFVMGILVLIFNLPALFHGLSILNTPNGKALAVLSGISVLVGFLMMFWHNNILMFLLGAYMILLPSINILLSKNRWQRLKAELPKLILGLVLILLGPANTVGILFDIAGGILIALSGLYVLTVYLTMKKHQNTPGARVFVDTDGNGTIDTVYVDTTGDGEADTATTYYEKQ